MKSWLLFLLSIFFFTNVHAQQRGCRSVMEGKFKVVGEGIPPTIVTRTKTLQTEEDKASGIIMTLDVTWLDDCTYTLRPRQVIKGDPALLRRDLILTVRIKEVNKNSYMAETSYSSDGPVMTFKVEILD